MPCRDSPHPENGHSTPALCQELWILVFDGTGLWILNKRLCSGRFGWPTTSDRPALSLRNEEFGALVNGLEVVAKKDWHRE